MRRKSDRQSVISRQPSAVSLQHIKAKPGVRAKGWSTSGFVIFFVIVGLLLIAQSSLLIAANAPVKKEEKKTEVKAKAEVKADGRTEEKKISELTEKEEALKREEERLRALKKELDEKIDRYTKLLGRMEEVLRSMDAAKGEQYEHLIRAYEAMPNEDAAARLSALDEHTAIKILVRIKSKKAGAVMAAMDSKKAATLTEGMMSMAKKFPIR